MNRKLFIMFICFLAMNLKVHAQLFEPGKAFLQHNGEIVSVYSYNELDKAINDAIEGDTIFLSKGSFQDGFTINKSISLIGTSNFYVKDEMIEGDGTKINVGDVTTWNYIKESNGKVIPSVMIEGIYFATSLLVESPVNNLRIKQCYFLNNLELKNVDPEKMESVAIDRCLIWNELALRFGIKTFVNNCHIYSLSFVSDSSQDDKLAMNTWFEHCSIYNVGNDVRGVFQNSIIERVNYGRQSGFLYKPYFVNTLYYKEGDSDPFKAVNLQDCWVTTEPRFIYKTKEELLKGNYIGTDGTVVGKDGGETPFSLVQNRPQVTVKEFKADVDNRKVSVNVTTE